MKSNQFVKILLFCFTSLLFGCQAKWQKALKKVEKSKIYNNDYKKWELVQEFRNEFHTYYTLRKNDGDTLKILFLAEENNIGLVYVNGYRKKFKCKIDTCNLEMTSQDTLFFYKQNTFGEKKFEVGEYAYRFTYFRMDSIEGNYYLKHEDSLRRVKGNNLPKLRKIGT